MKNIRDTVLLNRYYFLWFLLYVVVSLSFLLYTSKAASFLYLNSFHTKLLDLFFISYTNLGDGVFTILVVLILLASKKYNIAWQILAAFVISGLVAQLLKNFVVSPRPKEFFELKQHIYLINGITLSGKASFPSGHTASIFALTTMLAIFAKNKKASALYLIAALLVAYSRIYLSQHFLTDVLAGSVIGVLVAIFVYSFFDDKLKNWPERSKIKRKRAAAYIE